MEEVQHRIKAVIAFTLDRRSERRWAWLGAMKAQQVPDDVVHIMSAMDGGAYPNIESLVDAVVEDGFPWFERFKDPEWDKPEHPHSKLGSLATTWSFLRAFRKVIELDVLSIVMVDNYYLGRWWWDFNRLIETLDDLRILQLHHWDSRKHPNPEFRNDNYPRVPWYPDEVCRDVSKGLAGVGDSVLLLSPSGAQQIIDWSEEQPHFLIENLLWYYAHQGVHPGCYSIVKYERERNEWADGRIFLEKYTGAPDSERTTINNRRLSEIENTAKDSKMRIVSVNVINLERRTDLADAQLGTWKHLGFNESEIVFHQAIDGMKYDNRVKLIEDAAADGFPFFREFHEEPADHWMGIGELACMWSIARLLRHISEQPGNDVYLYVLADRYGKKTKYEMESIFSELPDFKFLQFRGKVPLPNIDGHKYWIDTGYVRPEPRFVSSPSIPENEIEHDALKLGDGVIAMTPEGARWMQQACDPYIPSMPYEIALLYLGSEGNIYQGIYSTYFPADEDPEQVGNFVWNYDIHPWEGEFNEGSLGDSEIFNANATSQTGWHGNHE